MRYQVHQTKSAISANYEILKEQQIIYTASIPFKMTGYRISFHGIDQTQYTLEREGFEVFRNNKSDNEKVIDGCFIKDSSNTVCGTICRKRTKGFKGYYFFELSFYDSVFQFFEIGLGKNGIKIPVYVENNQIALIEKGTCTIDNLDFYDILVKDENDAKIVSFFCVYYDFIRFGNHGQINTHSKKVSYLYTGNKKLLEKYDPNWFC